MKLDLQEVFWNFFFLVDHLCHVITVATEGAQAYIIILTNTVKLPYEITFHMPNKIVEYKKFWDRLMKPLTRMCCEITLLSQAETVILMIIPELNKKSTSERI